jgi:peptidoglycan/LPS O-acetylase OafA/YrhL
MSLVVIVVLWSIGEFEGTKDFVMIFVIAGLISMLYCEKGYCIPRGNKICQYLGTLSLSMYLFHRPIEIMFMNLFGVEWFTSNAILTLISVMVFSIVVVVVVKVIVKRNITNKVSKIVIER